MGSRDEDASMLMMECRVGINEMLRLREYLD